MKIDATELLSKVDAKIERWESQVKLMSGGGTVKAERQGMVLGLKHFRSVLVKEMKDEN